VLAPGSSRRDCAGGGRDVVGVPVHWLAGGIVDSHDSIKDQLSRIGGAAEQLRWLASHRMVGPIDILEARGLVPKDLAIIARKWIQTQPPASDKQIREERRVLRAFVSASVRTLALKGCLLAHSVYPKPAQRWRADLDILVDPCAINAGRDVLKSLGYHPMWDVAGGTPIPQESWLLGEGPNRKVVDLHWKVRSHPILRDRLSFEEQWRESIELPLLGDGVRGQCQAHALLNAVMHWFDRLYGEPRPIGWLLDMDLLWRALSESDQARLQKLAVDRELSGLTASALALAKGVLGTPVQGAYLAELSEHGRLEKPSSLIELDGRRWRSVWFALSVEPGLRAKVSRLRASLFPPKAHMKQRYGTRSGFGLSLAYLKRVWARF